MLVEYGVKVVLVCVEGVLEGSSKSSVATVIPASVVVLLPELEGSDIAHYEESTSLAKDTQFSHLYSFDLSLYYFIKYPAFID